MTRRDWLRSIGQVIGGILCAPLLPHLPTPARLPAPVVSPTITPRLWWLDGGPFVLRVSDEAEYQFAFTGFRAAEDEKIIRGQILMHLPRQLKYLHGITD